jgi:hypothetical protein
MPAAAVDRRSEGSMNARARILGDGGMFAKVEAA